MKKKFNWGFGIAGVFTIFLIFVTSNIIYFMSKDVDLVAKNYYEKGTDYQQQIRKISNNNELKEKLIIVLKGENIEFIFPEEVKGKNVKGIVTFYRPSDSKQDKYFEFNLDKVNEFVYNTKDLIKGMWRIKVDWTMRKKNYYSEETIIVN